MREHLLRIGLIVLIAVLAHVAVLGVRGASRALLRSKVGSEAKVQTLTSFFASVAVFGIYFAAVGSVLHELGISLAAYLAGASVIGLAVSFGSQGMVQDVITGLTVVFSDLIDVGDMIEISGQTGIVESIGIRFTRLVGFTGARVFIPNRTITHVINYPKGYVRAFVDVRLPEAGADDAEAEVRRLAEAAQAQLPGILLLPPSVEGRVRDRAGVEHLRVKFRIWPGQGAVLEGSVRQRIVASLRRIDPDYADWMVLVHYRAEPQSPDPRKALPRPAALHGRRA